MASKLQARIEKLETLAAPKVRPVFQVWFLDGEYHTRTTSAGEVIRMNAAEWQEHIKKDDCRVITVKYDDTPAAE